MNLKSRINKMEALEGSLLIVILLVVAGAAGAASFTHVHDWTMANTPADTPGWFGWANAVISELVPVAALLTIRRRKRLNQPVGYPIMLLISAAGLSLAAQLAVAKPSPSGWLLSAVPALAFMALVKLVLAPTTTSVGQTAADDTVSAATHEPDTRTPIATGPAAMSSAPVPAAVIDRHPTPEVPARLVSAARMITMQHRQMSTEPITADELASRLNTTPAIAGQLLTVIDTPDPTRINGNIPVLGGTR
jgi:hypothetical protein